MDHERTSCSGKWTAGQGVRRGEKEGALIPGPSASRGRWQASPSSASRTNPAGPTHLDSGWRRRYDHFGSVRPAWHCEHHPALHIYELSTAGRYPSAVLSTPLRQCGDTAAHSTPDTPASVAALPFQCGLVWLIINGSTGSIQLVCLLPHLFPFPSAPDPPLRPLRRSGNLL
jgi:hypothetical protein